MQILLTVSIALITLIKLLLNSVLIPVDFSNGNAIINFIISKFILIYSYCNFENKFLYDFSTYLDSFKLIFLIYLHSFISIINEKNVGVQVES